MTATKAIIPHMPDPNQVTLKTANLIAIREAHGNACNRCGETEGKLYVHHRDDNHFNNALDNHEVLCPRCHRLHHEHTHLAPYEMQTRMLTFWQEHRDWTHKAIGSRFGFTRRATERIIKKYRETEDANVPTEDSESMATQVAGISKGEEMLKEKPIEFIAIHPPREGSTLGNERKWYRYWQFLMFCCYLRMIGKVQ